MGLWSKGIDRSRNDILRREDEPDSVISKLTGFMIDINDDLYHSPVYTYKNLKGELMLHVKYGQHTTEFKVKYPISHVSIMSQVLTELDKLLIYVRDVNNLFVIRDMIHKNIENYRATGKIEELYKVKR